MERRTEERHLTVKAAEILFGHTSIECVVFDASASGIKLYLPSPPDIPELVTLRLPNGAYQVARRAWVGEGLIGFEFLAALPS